MHTTSAHAKTTVSIVVRTYNRSALLKSTLQSIFDQETYDSFVFEVIVVDNGSTDDTKEMVQDMAQEAPIPLKYAFEELQGPSHAINRGITEAAGEFIAFCDDDQVARHDWLHTLVSAALDRGALYIGGSIRLELSPERVAGLGLVSRVILGEHDYSGRPRPIQGKGIPSLGNLLVARKVFDHLGAFNTAFESGGEDTDFSRKVQQAGYQVWIAPEALVHHVVPSYRLTTDYLKWVSLRWGKILAQRDREAGGLGRVLLMGSARSVHTLLCIAPRLLFWKIRNAPPKILDCRCLLWRATAYIRTCFQLAVPRLFPQATFFHELEFRRERELFTRQGKGNLP